MINILNFANIYYTIYINNFFFSKIYSDIFYYIYLITHKLRIVFIYKINIYLILSLKLLNLSYLYLDLLNDIKLLLYKISFSKFR